jgi:DSF synthase
MFETKKGRALLRAVAAPETEDLHAALDVERPALSSRYDPAQRAVWLRMRATPRPCFTPQLLTDILAQQEVVAAARQQVDFVVAASAIPGVFNLGGDLDLFRSLSLAKDTAALLRYAEACCRAVYNSLDGLGQGLVTIAVVQGDALGGGLEAALSCQIVVAEKGAKMGFPEMQFNLFPGMGAFSLVARKVGPRVAEELITSGRTSCAEELHALGLVDHLAEPGMGERVAQNVIDDKAHCLNGFRAYQKAKRHTGWSVNYEELVAITREWVAAACTLTERDVRLMHRLVRAQDRLASARARLPVLAPLPAA